MELVNLRICKIYIHMRPFVQLNSSFSQFINDFAYIFDKIQNNL